MITNRSYRKYLALVVLALVCTLQAQDSGNVIPFQGQLANQAGQPLSPTNAVTLVFRLYQVAVGGVAIWEESQPSISVSAGRFSVLLGSRTLLPAQTYFNSTLYLGITVDDGNPATADVELRPRQALVPVISAKFAQNSDKLRGYDWSALFGPNFGTNNPADGKLDGSRIATNSIMTAQIGPQAINSNQLAPGAVTAAAIANGAIGSQQIAGGAVGALQIAQSGIQTSNLADGLLTLPKLAPRQIGTNVGVGGLAISEDCGTQYFSGSGSIFDVTNLTVTITTTGRPVFVGLVGDTNNASQLYVYAVPGNSAIFYPRLMQGSNLIYRGSIRSVVASPGGISGIEIAVPSTAVHTITFPPAGTWTYKFQVECGPNSQATVQGSRLAAYEL